MKFNVLMCGDSTKGEIKNVTTDDILIAKSIYRHFFKEEKKIDNQMRSVQVFETLLLSDIGSVYCDDEGFPIGIENYSRYKEIECGVLEEKESLEAKLKEFEETLTSDFIAYMNQNEMSLDDATDMYVADDLMKFEEENNVMLIWWPEQKDDGSIACYIQEI